MNDLEQRVADLEEKVQKLREALEECCGGEGPGPGRPCRGGRAVLVSGYELTSVEEATDMLRKIGLQERSSS